MNFASMVIGDTHCSAELSHCHSSKQVNLCIEISMFPYFLRRLSAYNAQTGANTQNSVKTVMEGSFRNFEKVRQGWPNLLIFF